MDTYGRFAGGPGGTRRTRIARSGAGWRGIPLFLFFGLGGCAIFGGFGSDRPALLIPFYTYPDRNWDLLLQARRDHPRVPLVAIMNPASGPGESPDPNYVAWMARLRKAGVTLLGYVTTSYGMKEASRVNQEVDRWVSWYRPDGIFYDEMAYETGHESYYRELDRYAKGKGLGLTVGNPGTEVREGYVGSLDVIILYENAGLPELELLEGWHAPHGRGRWGILPYGVPAVDRGYLREASRRVAYLYMTDRGLPDPWDLPPRYFADLVAALD